MLAHFQPRFFQLFGLEAQEVDPVASFFRRGAHPRGFATRREPRGSCLVVARPHLFRARKAVEEAQLLGGLEQPLVFVLPVNLQEQRGQLPQQAHRDRPLIEVRAGAPVRRHPTP